MSKLVSLEGLPKQIQDAILRVLNPSDLKTQMELSDLPEDKKRSIIKVIDDGNVEAIKTVREYLRSRKYEHKSK